MLRRILAVLVGLITGSVCITVVEKIGHALYPPPAQAEAGDMEALKLYVDQAPFMALFFYHYCLCLGSNCFRFCSLKNLK